MDAFVLSPGPRPNRQRKWLFAAIFSSLLAIAGESIVNAFGNAIDEYVSGIISSTTGFTGAHIVSWLILCAIVFGVILCVAVPVTIHIMNLHGALHQAKNL